MVRESKSIQMALFSKALIIMARRMVKENSTSKMDPSTPEIGLKIR
jgi:hypothetical protein